MKPMDLQSEPYSPTGSISAEGVKNQLGRPRLDRLSLLVRESVQNSWDARTAREGGVRFSVDGWTLTKEQRRWLSAVAFHDVPVGVAIRERLAANGPLCVLALSDRGTVGLCGPTRADEVRDGERANFVNLMRNVGQPPAVFSGGGTYGFGKTALFLSSEVRTIFVHSQIAGGKNGVQRFMGAALGSQFERRRSNGRTQRFTGRHWWGRDGRDGVAEPLTGHDAKGAALALGLPPFATGETGTTVLLIAPDFDGREPSEAIEYIGHAILRNFWPKMIDLPDSSASMEFHLSWAGQKFDVPRPSDLPPLDAFVRAYQNAREYLSGRAAPHSPSWLQDVRSQRPAKLLGTISLVRFPVAPRVEPHDEPESSSASPFEGPSQHVALMRGPRFVVEYKRGPAIAYELAEYAGVFVASDEAEEAFAKSEPPTHDDWSPDMLDARLDRTLVRVALSRIRDAMQEFTGAPSVPRTEAVDVTLGGFSDMLGGLMPAEAGTGARGLAGGSRANRGPSLGSGSGAESSARVRVLQTELVSAGAGVHPVCRILFDLGDDRRRSETEVIARAATLLDDGSLEVDPPLGMEIPQVLEWSDLHGTIATSGEGISIDARSTGPWTVTVSVPSDAAIGVELNARVAGS